MNTYILNTPVKIVIFRSMSKQTEEPVTVERWRVVAGSSLRS